MLTKFLMTEFKPTWILAQSDPYRTGGSSLPTPEEGTKEIHWFDDMAVVAGIGLVLMVLLAIWAKFFRSSPDSRKKSGTKDEFRTVPDASTLTDNQSGSDRRRKKRRRRRRDHRPRNPTLSETGGLPHHKDSNPDSA